MSAWERALQGRGGGNAAVVAARNRDAQRRQAEARVAATNARARAETILPSNNLFASSGTGRDYRIQPKTAEEQQQSRDLAEFVLFGPERSSALGGEASRPERFVRDWGLSEQEFRLAGESAREGNLGSAAGWATLGLAGVVPIVGDLAQGLARAGRASRLSSAVSDAARTLPVVESISEPFPVARFDEILDRTPIQVDIPVEYRTNPQTGLGETLRGPSSTFGSSANRAQAQIYRTPEGNFVYGSPSDVTIREPLLSADVGFRSRNPFDATSSNPFGVGANDLMQDYMGSVISASRAGIPTTDIDALMYLMRAGDTQARELYEGVARSSPRVPFLQTRPSPDLDDIVLVHSRSAPARMDTRGNALLWPAGDWRGGAQIPRGSHSRSSYFPWRGSIHFSQNARVAEAPLAGSWIDNRNYVLSRLNDVIEANPGSLGNLNPADTFFFAPPGRPLVLPNARNVEVPAAPTGYNPNRRFPSEIIELEDGTFVDVGGQQYYKPNEEYANFVNRILREQVNEMGGRFLGTAGEDFAFPQRDVMSQFLREEGVPLMGHGRGALSGWAEQSASQNFYRAGLGDVDDIFDSAILNAQIKTGEYSVPPTAESPEFWRRLLSGNYLTGAEPIRYSPDTSMYNF